MAGGVVALGSWFLVEDLEEMSKHQIKYQQLEFINRQSIPWLSVSDFIEHLVERAGGFCVGSGFFFAQGAEVFVVLDFCLHLQELLVGQNDEFLAAVFFDDLWMDAHGGFSGRIPFDVGYDKQ